MLPLESCKLFSSLSPDELASLKKVTREASIRGGTEIFKEEDPGKGIAPQMRNKLCEAFETFGKSHGTGLGLSIAKRIMEEHHGRMYARNVPGGGALFGFTLPLAK